jgi:outer membrane lipoprotein-sorting protein
LVLLWILFAQAFAGETTSEQTAIRALDQAEARRETGLAGYSVTEHYTLQVGRFSGSAEMTVDTIYRRGQGKSFHVVSRSGSSILQSTVFDRLLGEEGKMSRGDARQHALVNSDNYAIRLIGEETLAGTGRCYVLELTPRTKSPYLLRGRAWINSEDGSLIRIEGIPAAKASFLSGTSVVTREYEEVGEFWLARSSHAVSDGLLSGKTDLRIEYRDYHVLDDADLR